jgi:hypothetical protein
MFKKTVFCYFSIIGIFLLLTVSCEIFDDDCGPFNNYNYKITGFETNLKQVVYIDSVNQDVQLSSPENDTLYFDELAIQMIPDTESYTAQAKHKLNFSFSETAYACSPPIPSSEDKITDIQIFSNKNYSNEFSSQENISELFDIVVQYPNRGNQRFSLNEFLAAKPEAPTEIILLPNTAPSSTNSFQFTVKYFQDGLELDEYQFTTDSIVIKK